jgi:hypothetical protein
LILSKRGCHWLLALFLCVCFGAQAESIVFIGGGGTVSYDPTNGKLVGANIAMDQVIGKHTPLHAGQPYTVDATLAFETGQLEDDNDGELIFAAGGSFTITGIFQAAGITQSRRLLDGQFLGATFSPLGEVSLVLGTGTDQKDADLVSFFFGSASPAFEFSGDLMTDAVANPSSGFSNVAVVTADITNQVVPVPEPGALTELALLLVAFAPMALLVKVYRARTN